MAFSDTVNNINDRLFTLPLDSCLESTIGHKRKACILSDNSYNMDDEDEASGTKRFKTAETISSPDIVSPVSMASSYSGMGGESPVLSPVIDEWLTTFSCWSLDYKTQALNRLIKM
jgi:hypothetical protein